MVNGIRYQEPRRVFGKGRTGCKVPGDGSLVPLHNKEKVWYGNKRKP